MQILTFLDRFDEAPRKRFAWWRQALAALVSGVAGTAVLALVNAAANEIANNGYDSVDWLLAGGFLAAVAAFAVAEVMLLTGISARAERAVAAARTGIARNMAVADYDSLMRIGPQAIFESLTRDAAMIGKMAQFLAIGLRSAVLVLCMLVYVATLSMLALALVSAVVAVGSVVFLRRDKRLQAMMWRMLASDSAVFERISDLLNGFKQMRMRWAGNEAWMRRFRFDSRRAMRDRLGASIMMVDQGLYGQVVFFLLLGVVVFIVPAYSTTFASDVVQVATAVLFLTGPISMMVTSISNLGYVNAAAGRLMGFERAVSQCADPDPAGGEIAVQPPESIVLNDLTFAYPNGADETAGGFRLGPVAATIKGGRIVFITGGNGAGKSTLIRLMTGLTRPHSGSVSVDGRLVSGDGLAYWRAHVSAVYADGHLFRRLYGLKAHDPVWRDSLLRMFELDGIVSVSGDRFSRIDLSTGQKKRLALVAALLEERPVLVLDEWAADQDPQFRRKFYREILPALKARGLTIIAVTHDDHYFEVADTRLHMEDGRLSEVAGAEATP